MSSNRGHKRKKPKTIGGDPAAPSPDEWAKMTPYGRFIVTDPEGREVIFSLGDTAAVLPGGTKVGTELPTHKYWLVRILAIRGRPLPTKKRPQSQAQAPEIWVEVNWFYSPTEVSYKLEGFNPSHCHSKFERIYSDHSEFVSALTFNALVPVIKFREDDPGQDPIGGEEFFCRYFLKTSSIRAEIKSYVLSSSTHLEESVGCICGNPYNVRDKNPLQLMNMCPRPRCRRFYHVCCLLECGHWSRMTDPLIRLLCSPDTDETPVFPFNLEPHPSGCSSLDAVDVHLPPNLLMLAAQPIVRGAALPALGITGNSHDVIYARRLVYAALRGTAVPEVWEDLVDLAASVVDRHLPILKLEETDEMLVFACPDCSGPI